MVVVLLLHFLFCCVLCNSQPKPPQFLVLDKIQSTRIFPDSPRCIHGSRISLIIIVVGKLGKYFYYTVYLDGELQKFFTSSLCCGRKNLFDFMIASGLVSRILFCLVIFRRRWHFFYNFCQII